MLVCRAEREIPRDERRKSALFCNVREEAVISALDVKSIYQVPRAYQAEGLDDEVCRHFQLDAPQPELARWDTVTQRIAQPDGEVTIGVVGKYVSLLDAYKSLAQSPAHGGIATNVTVTAPWLDSEIFESARTQHTLEGVTGIQIPGA